MPDKISLKLHKLKKELKDLSNKTCQPQVTQAQRNKIAREIVAIKASIPRQKLDDPKIWEDCGERTLKIVKELIRVGVYGKMKYSTIFEFACGSDAEIVEFMLRHGMRPNVRIGGYFPLTIACMNGQEEVVKVLLKFGADPNGKDWLENVPFRIACDSDHFNIATLLINKGSKFYYARNHEWLEPDYLLDDIFGSKSINALNLITALIVKGTKLSMCPTKKQSWGQMFQYALRSKNIKTITAFVSLCGYEILPELNWAPSRQNLLPCTDEILVQISYETGKYIPVPTKHKVKTANDLYKKIWEYDDMCFTLAWWNGQCIFPRDQFLCALGMCNASQVVVYPYKVMPPWLIPPSFALPVDEWSPTLHHLYPKLVQDSVLCFLLVIKRLGRYFDTSIRNKIIQYICFGWLLTGN